MRMNNDLLFHLLNEEYSVYRFYHNPQKDRELMLPVFYRPHTETVDGGVYITRLYDMPKNVSSESIFIVSGDHKPTPFGTSHAEIFFINDADIDIFALFNKITGFFNQILTWHDKMTQYLRDGADLEQYVKCSLPIFENCITITDYTLRILVTCDILPSPEHKIVISDLLSSVPSYVGARYTENFYEYITKRKPFFTKGIEDTEHNIYYPDGNNYCINLFQSNTYLGTCTLFDRKHKLRESDYILFHQFSDYIRQALSTVPETDGKSIVTIKTLFKDLMNDFPVSDDGYKEARIPLDHVAEQNGTHLIGWRCLAICSDNISKRIPGDYVCLTLEDILPYSCSNLVNNTVFCLIGITESTESNDIIEPLTNYLKDMNFRCGISDRFDDFFRSASYARQANALLEIGHRISRVDYIYQFSDYILPYMLEHSIGEFGMSTVLASNLKELRDNDGGVDYWNTLKHYLNNECNASRTAEQLYIHRSSLMTRIDRIRKIIDLDTPEQRLYVRICMYLIDFNETHNIMT